MWSAGSIHSPAMLQAPSSPRHATQTTVLTLLAAIYVAAITACSYDVTFVDCQVTCGPDNACPASFTCLAGMCRAAGETGACGSNIQPGSVTLTQTSDTTVDHNIVASCTNADGTTAAQSWYRVFSLTAAGVSGDFHSENVDIGIAFAIGSNSVEVTIGSYSGAIGSATLDPADVTGTVQVSAPVPDSGIAETLTVPLINTISAGKAVYVEIDAPDLDGTGDQINIGSTDGTQTHPAYIEAPLCGTTVPTSTTAAGLSNAAFVITVEGSG
jgi:hypothetical protein